MCGINGIIYKNKTPNISEILQMNHSIKHRGPDDSGVLNFENVSLGHVRLSIQDVSSKGKQPMSNDGKFWIIYNGEIYNFKELRDELKSLGYKFYSNTDTEVILNSFKEWGIKSFEKFNGMWCFAILDKIKKEIILSRDRYGVKPCYYYCNNEKIIFSSEIKGLYSSDTNIDFDKNKIVHEEKNLEGAFTTIFKNVEIVPPGSYFKISLKNFKINKNRWWIGLNNVPSVNVNYNKAKERLKELLYQATKLRLVSDVPISTSLSGGIDSSIIFSILNNLEDSDHMNLNPFIYKDNNISFNQAIDLTKYYNKKPIIVEKIDENLIELSKCFASIEIPTTYFSQLEIYKKQNKNNFKVSIDGHGADECLGGYDKDLQMFPMYYQNSIIGTYQTLDNLKGKEYLNNIVNKFNFIKNLYQFKTEINNFYYTNNSINKRIEIFKNYIDAKKINLITDTLREDLNELKNFNFPFQILYFHANYGHMQWLLNKWDKASMASSVEIRSPYLDWNFFQYCLALPPEFKVNFGKNKLILRDSFKNVLPDSINTNNQKQGLKVIKYKNNNLDIKLMKEGLNQKSFIQNKIWDGKKVLSDFNLLKNNQDSMTKSKIWKIFCLHSLQQGFNDIKSKSVVIEKKQEESFNLLN